MCFNRENELEDDHPINMMPVTGEEKIDRICDSVEQDPPMHLHMYAKFCSSTFSRNILSFINICYSYTLLIVLYHTRKMTVSSKLFLCKSLSPMSMMMEV
jgi:hypothetical protein